ncbi:nucleoside 2-deoxyribosyltransferase domain-containing protein [Shewanella sp. A3A]|nr:nucleoside 2-deoxyribosyltransferase domain-containing protein [Shewanella ferrihydritica]
MMCFTLAPRLNNLVSLPRWLLTAALLLSPLAKAEVIVSPAPLPESNQLKVFLGGSIEMGKARNWQLDVVNAFKDAPIQLFNPRRADWDPAWQPVLSNPHFKQQVEWELNALEHSDIIIMYLAPGTQSPVSLMELGLYAASGKLIVICPEGFWRKGNVDAVTQRYNINTVDNIEDAIALIKSKMAAAQH